MNREMIDKNVAILELIADFKIEVTQLNEDCEKALKRADIAEKNMDILRTERQSNYIKIDRALISLRNMLKEDVVITKEDIQNCIEILKND